MGLIVAMGAGSLALWTVIPMGILWLVDRPSGAYAFLAGWSVPVVALGIVAGMALGAEMLTRLERAYMRVTHTIPRPRAVPGWRRSLSDSNPSLRTGVLERIMVASVLLALGAFTTWFIVFAHTGLPH